MPRVVERSTPHSRLHVHQGERVPPFSSVRSTLIITIYKYEAEVDLYERQVNREPVMVKKMFFAELHRLIRLEIPASEDLHLHGHEDIFLALVKTCKAEQGHHGHWRYSNLGGFEFIDLSTIVCTVGRVFNQGAWYIVDRNSELVR